MKKFAYFVSCSVCWIGTLAGQAALASQALPASKVHLLYSRQVPTRYRNLLDSDIQFLKSVQLKDQDGEMKRIMKLSTFSNQELEAWLAARAHYIVDEKFEFDHTKSVVLKSRVSFPSTSQSPNAAPVSAVESPDRGHDGVQVSMTNIGGLIYLYSKMTSQYLGVPVDGLGVIPVSSPRVGLFKVGVGLFQVPTSFAARTGEFLSMFFQKIRRLKTLFHESRHGDGHGGRILFPHVLCPKGHAYEGFFACDEAANGPYRIGSLFVRAAIDACQNCDRAQVEVLKLIYADDLSRILSPLKASGESPAGLRSQALRPLPVVEFDDAAEALRLNSGNPP